MLPLQLWMTTVINITHTLLLIFDLFRRESRTTWIKKNDELETYVFRDIKLELNKLAEDGMESVCKLSSPKQCQGQKVKLLTIGQRGLILKGKDIKLGDGLMWCGLLQMWWGSTQDVNEGKMNGVRTCLMQNMTTLVLEYEKS